MRAVVYDEFGPSTVLRVRDIDDPSPTAGEIRVRVGASSVNPIDAKFRAGLLSKIMEPRFPAQVGFDAAGVVDQVGSGVTGVEPGDRVFGLTTGGGAAALAVLRAWAPTPHEVTDVAASPAALAGITAVKAIDQLRLRRGAHLLVIGAGGAVGSIAMQVASARGHEVTGVAAPTDRRFVERSGARFIAAGEALARRITGSGFPALDAVLDATSGGALEELAGLLTDSTQILTIAGSNPGDFGARSYEGRAGEPFGPLAEIAELLARGSLEVRVVSTLPLEKAAEGQDRIDAGHVGGRIVLVP